MTTLATQNNNNNVTTAKMTAIKNAIATTTNRATASHQQQKQKQQQQKQQGGGRTTTTPPILTAKELQNQRLFSILVATCFFSFLFGVIGYVAFMHVRRNRLMLKNRRKMESQSKDKPQINRRTSVMGQGQKQVVIERKASLMGNRRHSSVTSASGINGAGCSISPGGVPQLNTKLLRNQTPPNYITTNVSANTPSVPPYVNNELPSLTNHYPSPPPPTMIPMGGYSLPPPHAFVPPYPNYAHQQHEQHQQPLGNGDPQPLTTTTNGGPPQFFTPANLTPPISASRIPNHFSFPNTYPLNTFNENVLVRYGCNDDNGDIVNNKSKSRNTAGKGKSLSSNKEVKEEEEEHNNKSKKHNINNNSKDCWDEHDKDGSESSDNEEEDGTSNIGAEEVFITTTDVSGIERPLDSTCYPFATLNEGTRLLLSP